MIDFYFAYGSNMNPQRMLARGVASSMALPGTLRGFELCFDKRALGRPRVAHANIRHCPGDVVEGVLYQLMDPVDIERLDRFEGTPVRYSREVYVIDSPMGEISAWVYVGNRAMLAADLLPERDYLEHLLAAKSWISPRYFQRLAGQRCIDVDGYDDIPEVGEKNL